MQLGRLIRSGVAHPAVTAEVDTTPAPVEADPVEVREDAAAEAPIAAPDAAPVERPAR